MEEQDDLSSEVGEEFVANFKIEDAVSEQYVEHEVSDKYRLEIPVEPKRSTKNDLFMFSTR